jgi:hypothetical protein
MAEASNDPIDPDIHTLSPSEAGAVLDARSLDFLPTPAPLVPANANEARARVAELSADPAFLKAYFAGDVAARKQMDALNEMIAGATDADVLSAGQDAPQFTDVTSGPEGLRRKDVLSAAADLRALWDDSDNCEAAIAEVLNPDATVPDDLLQNMQAWKAQALTDPAFVDMLMRGDRWATQRMTLANAVIAIGTPA